MYLVFDTETTGLPLWNDPSDHPGQPHIVDLACTLFDAAGLEVASLDMIVNPGVEIPVEVARIHGITTEVAQEYGVDPREAHDQFMSLLGRAELLIGHNVSFDVRMMRILAARVTGEKWDNPLRTFCTMRKSTNLVRVLGPRARHPEDWKWPNLGETVQHFFGEPHENAHRARSDCDAAARVFFHLKQQGIA